MEAEDVAKHSIGQMDQYGGYIKVCAHQRPAARLVVGVLMLHA